MTLRSVAYKNFKENLRLYPLYYVGNTMAVTIFFLLANMLEQSSLSPGEPMGILAKILAKGMLLGQVMIIIFSVFFSTYVITRFIKSRDKEFGLLAVLGMTKGELRGYMLYENLLGSILSIAMGLILGLLFSRLLFVAFSILMFLERPIGFLISKRAIGRTIGYFFVIFQASGVVASQQVVRLLANSPILERGIGKSLFF